MHSTGKDPIETKAERRQRKKLKLEERLSRDAQPLVASASSSSLSSSSADEDRNDSQSLLSASQSQSMLEESEFCEQESQSLFDEDDESI